MLIHISAQNNPQLQFTLVWQKQKRSKILRLLEKIELWCILVLRSFRIIFFDRKGSVAKFLDIYLFKMLISVSLNKAWDYGTYTYEFYMYIFLYYIDQLLYAHENWHNVLEISVDSVSCFSVNYITNIELFQLFHQF